MFALIAKLFFYPSDICFLCCHWLDFWAVRQKKTPRKMLEEVRKFKEWQRKPLIVRLGGCRSPEELKLKDDKAFCAVSPIVSCNLRFCVQLSGFNCGLCCRCPSNLKVLFLVWEWRRLTSQ
jgi:hypothetical protein